MKILFKKTSRGCFSQVPRCLQRKKKGIIVNVKIIYLIYIPIRCIIQIRRIILKKSMQRRLYMTRASKVYEYLISKYSANEPIFLSEIEISDMNAASVRQQMKKLVTDSLVKRFDTGIYYIPGKSMFRSGSTLSVDEVIKKKYLMNENTRCGYISGIQFANQLGLTTQAAGIYEIYTNKATKDYREILLSNHRVILRKPYVKVNDQNANILQFMDLLKEITDISEIEGQELTNALIGYMKKREIKFDDMKMFLQYYPERIYKNMYEVGLLNGVSA